MIVTNSRNRLKATQAKAPNLPSDVYIVQNVKFDRVYFTRVCAANISLGSLEQMGEGSDPLWLDFKVDPNGSIIEIDFLIDEKSLLTAKEIADIEKELLRSGSKFIFTPGIGRLLEGANFFTIPCFIRYKEMLKVKSK